QQRRRPYVSTLGTHSSPRPEGRSARYRKVWQCRWSQTPRPGARSGSRRPMHQHCASVPWSLLVSLLLSILDRERGEERGERSFFPPSLLSPLSSLLSSPSSLLSPLFFSCRPSL